MAHVLVKLLQRDVNFIRLACANLSRRNECGYIYRCFSSDATSKEEKALSNVENDAEEMTEEMAARDVSRMPKRYRDRMKHVMNPPEQPNWYDEMFQSIDSKRRLYGKFGRKSGLDPGILWPSKEEVQEQIEFEKEWEPSLKEMLRSIEERHTMIENAKERKRQLVAKQMARMPQFIKDHHAKKSKVAEQECLHEAKHHELMEEARDYFGYNIDPKDPRFEEMKLKKEEEEMKLAKKKKKEAKALRLIMGLSAPKSQ